MFCAYESHFDLGLTITDRNAPVKVNPEPPPPPSPARDTWSFIEALSRYWQAGPQSVGDSRRMWSVSRGFVLIQDGGDLSRKDFLVHFGTLERTQGFTGICEIHFIVIQINTLINLKHGLKKADALILRCRWLLVSLLCKDNVSKCCWFNLWNVMT